MTQISEEFSAHLRAAVRSLGRRRFVTVTGAAAALAFSVGLPGAGTAHAAAPADAAGLDGNPFTLGVASGDPQPDSVVLWTRLATDPHAPDSGLPAEPLPVRWEIARDRAFERPVDGGTVLAHPEFHHSVHVEAGRLAPGTDYYYRFQAGPWTSTTGRARTAPARHARVGAGLRFALVSCQRYDQGYYTAYRHLAAEGNIDAVIHLGDYLYEYAINAAAGARAYTGEQRLPAHYNRETVTLDDYRLRYSLYHADPDLQAAHAAHPWIVTWDDHEVDNNYASAVSQDDDAQAEFLVRRAAAYRAYYENMPLRRPQLPDGPDLRLYRRLHYGRLAQLDVLDTRQYRADQANGDGWKLPTDASRAPDRQLLGAAQERWLADGWRTSRAVWNLVPQQIVVARRRNQLAEPWPLAMDAWDGYPWARERLLRTVRESGVRNLVVFTGDVHVHHGFDIKEDFDDPASRTLGVELVTTSISSGGNGNRRPANWEAMMTVNPHLRFYDGRRGYVLVSLDERQVRADYRVVSGVTVPGGEVSTAGSFVSRAGDPGLFPA